MLFADGWSVRRGQAASRRAPKNADFCARSTSSPLGVATRNEKGACATLDFQVSQSRAFDQFEHGEPTKMDILTIQRALTKSLLRETDAWIADHFAQLNSMRFGIKIDKLEKANDALKVQRYLLVSCQLFLHDFFPDGAQGSENKLQPKDALGCQGNLLVLLFRAENVFSCRHLTLKRKL